MREIKFRAKRIDANKFPSEYQWVYGHYFKTPLTDENSGTSPESGWFFLSGEPRHCIVKDGVSFVIDVNTLGQYIGFKTDNDKEIYEDDIVEIDSPRHKKPYIFRVGFTRGSFVFGGWLPRDVLNMETELKVIGNVYDNPDLLKR